MTRRVEGRTRVRHPATRPMANENKRGRGRPVGDPAAVKQATVSARLAKPARLALEKMARLQHRKVTEMARIIIVERLIADGLLPEDFDF